MLGRALPLLIVAVLGYVASLIPMAALAQTEPIKVGIYQNAPKIFIDDANQSAGFLPDLLNHIANKEMWMIGILVGSVFVGWFFVLLLRRQVASKTVELQESLQALEENESHYRQLVDNLPEIVYSLSDKTGGIYYSPSVESVLGYAPERLKNNPQLWHDSIHPDDLVMVEAAIEALHNGQSFNLQYRIRDANGNWHWLHDQSTTIESGDEIRIEGLATDITKLKHAEEIAHNLSQIVERSSATIIITDSEGIIEYVNPKFVETTGYSAEEAIGQNPRLIQSGLTPLEQYEELWQTIAAGDVWRGKFQNRHKDGTFYLESAVISPIKATDGTITHFFAIKDNITEHMLVEEELQKSEKRLIDAQRIAQVGNWGWNVDTGELSWSDEIYRIFGQEPQSFEATYEKFLETIFPDDRQAVLTAIEKALRNESPYSIDHRITQPDGSIRYVHEQGEVLFDEAGEPTQMFGTVYDITERKALEDQLLRSQKMDAIGQLTGGIAHDFNNILGVVIGNLELLRDSVSGNDKALGRLENALAGARRGADLTGKLLRFSHQESKREKLASINDFIQNMEELLTKALTVAIDVKFHLSEDVWPVIVDPGDLQDAILNLALNARDAMPAGGSLVIETANKVLDEDYVKQAPQSRVGEFVVLSVSDTGTGMTAEVRERVYEPFFSTKAEAKGTGLGLSMVYGFVQRSQGHMNIYSEPQKGTTINIYLPRAHERAEREERETAQVGLPRGSETILVVDDEKLLVDIAVSHLEILGYRVLSANNAKQAWKVLEKNQDVDLLFSDVIMPGEVDGYKLGMQAMREWPNLKVLLTSGFTKKREESVNGDQEIYAELASSLLNKPYSRADLAFAIRRILDE